MGIVPGLGAPHFGHVALLAKTVFLLFTHPEFGQRQSPGILAFRAVPHLGHAPYFPKTNLELLMQVVFGHVQSPGISPPCMPGSAFCIEPVNTSPCAVLHLGQ